MKDKIPPTDHPGPYQSILWHHIADIRKMRALKTDEDGISKPRFTWDQIAAAISEKAGRRIVKGTLFNFYTRFVNRKKPLPKTMDIENGSIIFTKPEKREDLMARFARRRVPKKEPITTLEVIE